MPRSLRPWGLVLLMLGCRSNSQPEPTPPPSLSASTEPLVAAPAVDPAHLAERRRLAEVALHAPRPSLGAVSTPALTAALHDPERAWAMLVAPETPYPERRALAAQWKDTFSLEFLPRLVRALAELRAESAAHGWGLEPHPSAALPPFGPHDPVDGSRVASVLGSPWTVRQSPAGARDYPLTWEEEAAAPWPWQVQETLEQLFVALAPRTDAAENAWLKACERLPWASDADAALLVEASLGARHRKTTRVMALWHAIAISPSRPRAAELVARSVGEATRTWDAPESQAIGEVIVVDLLAGSNHPAREHAAYGLRALALRERGGRDERLKPPSTAILGALALSQDPAAGDPWKRLYVYGFSALEAMVAPPFVPDRTIAPTGPDAAARAEELGRWFVANRQKLEAESASRKRVLDPTRRALEQEAFNASRRAR